MIKIGQSEPVRPVDDDGIRVRNIEAALDDRRADKHVDLTGNETGHDGFQFIRVHLSVAKLDARLGAELGDPFARFLDRLHPIVEEINLALPIEFPVDCVANDPLIVSAHDGFHRKAVERRGFDGGHVFHADKGKVERSRDRSGREGEDIHEFEELFELLFVQDAEALLFVDHDQPKILEHHVAGDEAMGADHDVHSSVAQELQDLPLFGVGSEAAQHFDADRVIEHALSEGFEMLLREDGGRGQEGDLFSFHHGFEGGPNRHLRFPESDVATDQAIHRTGLFHVALGCGDGRELIRRLAVGERMFELALPLGVGAEGVAQLGFALGLHGQHFPGVIEDRGGGVLFRSGPFCICE